MHERLTRRALRLNAGFSLLSGLSLLLLAAPLAPLFGVEPSWVLRVIGAGLLFFAAGVGVTARNAPLRRGWAMTISMMDLAWVVGTLVLALAWPGALSALGWLVAACVALFVALFCGAQMLGLRRGAGNSAQVSPLSVKGAQ